MPEQFRDWVRGPRVVVTIHGILTRGRWQKEITPYLARYGLVPYHIDYGFFPALLFFLGITRKRQIESIRKELRSVAERVGYNRFSIVAHSFGTLAVMNSLLGEHGAFKFDRVVLTGCILENEFPWKKAFDDGLVKAVRNEMATNDWVVNLAAFVSKTFRLAANLRAGNSGKVGFSSPPGFVLQYKTSGGHSSTHNNLKYEQWARFLSYPQLPKDSMDRIVSEMQMMRSIAAEVIGKSVGPSPVPVNYVRCNVFVPSDTALRISPGLVDNMHYAPEFCLQLQKGHGATGAAYSGTSTVSGQARTWPPCWSLNLGGHWSAHQLPESERQKINPALKWVISMPILSSDKSFVLGIFNIDGIDFNDEEAKISWKTVPWQTVVLAVYSIMNNKLPELFHTAYKGEQLEFP